MRREIGVALILMGILAVMASSVQSTGQGEAGYGGVVLIGPVPIIFGSSPEMAIFSMVMAAALMMVYFALFLRGKR